MYACIHIHTYIHRFRPAPLLECAHIHTWMHTYTYARAGQVLLLCVGRQGQECASTSVYKHTITHTYMDAYMHAHIQARAFAGVWDAEAKSVLSICV